MAKKTVVTDAYLVVRTSTPRTIIKTPDDPRRSFYVKDSEDPKDFKGLFDSIQADIRHHVDDVTGMSPVVVTKDLCSFCERLWELDDEGPVCCQETQEEWNAEHLKEATC